ncbi:GNAT family N-acetyltransferase [uncultured Tenacibaculum sp.]|uniref:GNAT family N-acetyltransferase n=1 Tax=uncultured Tenacibaculum sp. TaxID=174713 RepID=UPI00260677E1|nr:GNAT family N-acetyltransferase [uncultured Tenacibaculum sp.]
MNISFKLITPQQINSVLKLFKETAEKIHQKNINHWQYWKNPPIEKINWVKEGIQNEEFFFIENGDENMGMVRIMTKDTLYWGEQEIPAKYIHSLVIREKYNGKGLGAIIIQQISDQAKKENYNYLRLDADSNNSKLCSYYENLGFKNVGIKKLALSTNTLYEKHLI